MRKVDVRIIGTRTQSSDSLLTRNHTVGIIQVYAVEVTLPQRTLVTEHRYSEFRALHATVDARQMTEEAAPLPFPKPVLMPLKASVVEERKQALCVFMTEAMKQSQLSRLLLLFLGVPAAEVDKALSPPPPPVQPVASLSGPTAVNCLHLHLLTQPNNRLKALCHFDAHYFDHSGSILHDSVRTLLADIVPLAGDRVCGAKALSILAKVITTGRVRNAQDFRRQFLRVPTEELKAMQLDKHLLGEFPGGTYEEAFTVAAALEQGLPLATFMSALSDSHEAFRRFKAWKTHEVLRSPEKPAVRKHSEEWQLVNCADFPGLSIQYQCEGEDCLRLAVALRIEACPAQVAEWVLEPEKRLQWDKWLKEMQVVSDVSESCKLVQLCYESDQVQITLQTYVDTRRENSALHITFRKAEEKNAVCLASYSFVEVAEGCQLMYQAWHTAEVRRFLTHDLVGERNDMKAKYWRLKLLAEGRAVPDDLPELSEACDRKGLVRQSKRHRTVR